MAQPTGQVPGGCTTGAGDRKTAWEKNGAGCVNNAVPKPTPSPTMGGLSPHRPPYHWVKKKCRNLEFAKEMVVNIEEHVEISWKNNVDHLNEIGETLE